MLQLHQNIASNYKSATCIYMRNCFYFVLCSTLARRSAQTYEKRSVFSVFSGLRPFHQVFGQVKQWRMLELHKTINVSRAVFVPSFFSLVL